MNRRPSSTQLLEPAIKGFLNFKSAEGLTDRSLESYQRTLSQWAEHTGSPPADFKSAARTHFA
jgi:hypothetical protein